MKGRPSKGRKTKSRSKAAKATRARSSKSKKASKSRKTSKAAAKRKTARRPMRSTARKTPGRKRVSPTSGRVRARKEVFGEGNYTASREFRRQQTGFVQRNKSHIPEMAEEAAQALEGAQRADLQQAEGTARSHSAGDED